MSDELIELPEGWDYTTVQEAIEIIDYRGRTPPYSEDGIPHLRSSNIKDGKVVWEGLRYVSEETYKAFMTRGLPQKGDVLFTTEAPLGEAALAPEQKFSLAQRMMLLRPNKNLLESKFLLYQIKNEEFQRKLKITGTGSTVTGVSSRNFQPLEIVIAPLNEQKRIVAKIEELNDRHQRAKQALEAIPELCDRFRQSVLAAAFRGDLTADWREENPDVEPASVLLERIRRDRHSLWFDELAAKGKDCSKVKYSEPIEPDISGLNNLPDTWEWASLDQILYSLRNGLARKPADELPGIPILRISAVRAMEVNIDDIRFYRPDISEEIDSYLIESGDILFTRYNGNQHFVGVCGLVSERVDKLLYPDKLIRGRLVNKALCLPKFLEIVCNVGVSRAHIEQHIKTSAGQHGIAGSDLKSTPIPLPPVTEQKAIVEIVGSQFSALKRLTSISDFCSESLQCLNQSMLAKAFRGELVEQDPNDEPASVLLDRIRAEREALQSNKKSGSVRGKRKKATDNQLDLPGMN